MPETGLSAPAEVPGLVSIVMPAYNAAEVIGEAISSVLAQTYPHWELLITDDGSSDATAAVVRGFADPRIKLAQQSNQGVSAARNLGLEFARGEFITFLDADDALPPRSLESRVHLLLLEPSVDVVDGVFIVTGPKLSVQLKQRLPGSRGLLLPRLLRLDEHVFRNGCLLFRTHLVGHIRFQPGMTHAEDLLFFIELAAGHIPTYAPIAEATYLYRTGMSSAMSNLDGWEMGYIDLLQKLRQIPHISRSQRMTTHLCIAKILLVTWLKQKQPIRAALATTRIMMMAL